MIKKIIVLLGAVFFLFSCAQDNFGSGNQGGNPSGGVAGLDPSNHSSGISSNNNCNVQGGEWGGVTCLGKSNRDQNFLGFVSLGVDISDGPTKGITGISCNPSNAGGILIRMNIALNAAFDPNGNNSNLAMQPASKLEIVIYDDAVNRQNLEPLAATYNGLQGTVNGNQAELTFDRFHNKYGRQEVRLDGRFDANYFQGTISYSNEKDWRGRSGASGTLGNFKIPTCPVFSQ